MEVVKEMSLECCDANRICTSWSKKLVLVLVEAAVVDVVFVAVPVPVRVTISSS